MRTLPPTVAVSPRGSDYAELSRTIKQAGLLDRRRAYYTWKISTTVVLGAAGLAAFLVIGSSWWQLAIAGYFAVISTQLGFLGHDAGHRQIFTSGRANRAFGVMLATAGIGLSYGWWVDKHNRHHAHPNDENKDPDIGAGALVFTTGQARLSRGFPRLMYRYQAYGFFPLLFLEAISLRVASIRYLLGAANRHRAREATLLALHVLTYLAVVFLVLSPVQAVVFIAIHQGLFGLYLGCSFAPNHKGMPTGSAEDNADYLRRQVLTSRNVRGHWLTDFVLGGLNYQIEHHLFPSMPRANLRRAQPIVQAFCQAHHVTYRQTGLINSYAQALSHLNMVGRSPDTLPAT